MKIIKGLSLILVPALMLVSASVAAFEGLPTVDAIVAEQTSLQKEIQSSSGRYGEMPAFKRNEILERQGRLLSLLEGKGDLSDLSPVEHTELSNHLEFIEAGLSNREDERIVCERVRKTGSKMVSKVCKSVAQLKAERAAAAQQMQSRQGLCNSSVCSESL